jgi:tetratricopeptide (TPR) repeat protein
MGFASVAVLLALLLAPLAPQPAHAQRTKRKPKRESVKKPVVHSIVVRQSLENAQAQKLFDEAVTLVDAKRYPEAAAKFEEALPFLRADDNRKGEASVLNNTGVTYALGGDHAKAMEYYNRSLDAATAVADEATQANVLYNLGVATYKLDRQPPEILDYFNRALDLYRKLGNRTGEADTLFNIGQVYQWNGEAARAREYYNNSLKVRVQ